MTDRRSSEDRRTEEGRKLAGEKQASLTGGNTNYYLTDLGYTVVEAEDVIERLRMEFHLATSFKSTDRLCKIRLGFGKPGSTPEYEIGKIVYYNKRTAAVSGRRGRDIGVFGKGYRWIRDTLMPDGIGDINDVVLDIPDPKRLAPYKFQIGDFIDALKPNDLERAVLENIFKVATMRQIIGPARRDERPIAQTGVVLAMRLEEMLAKGYV